MTATYKNIAPGAMLAKGDVVRISFAQEHAYLALDASFANDFGAIWTRLFELRVENVGNPAFPIGKNSVTKGMTTTVADLRVSRPVTVSALVNAIDSISGFYVAVSGVEKLGAMDAAGSAGTRGAVQREVKRNAAEAEQQQSVWYNQIASTLGVASDTLRWVALAVLGILLLVYLPRMRK